MVFFFHVEIVIFIGKCYKVTYFKFITAILPILAKFISLHLKKITICYTEIKSQCHRKKRTKRHHMLWVNLDFDLNVTDNPLLNLAFGTVLLCS